MADGFVPKPNAELRAEHRYLDLRHPTLSRNIRLRSQVAQAMRQTLLDEGEHA